MTRRRPISFVTDVMQLKRAKLSYLKARVFNNERVILANKSKTDLRPRLLKEERFMDVFFNELAIADFFAWFYNQTKSYEAANSI